MYTLIVRNNSNPQAVDASLLLMAYFESQALDFEILDVSELGNVAAREKVAACSDELQLAVVLGGDGSILHTVQLLAAYRVPILGINFGHLGFLANACEESVVSMVARALAGELSCERRTNLRVDVVCAGEVDPFETDGQISCDDADNASDIADTKKDVSVLETEQALIDDASSFGIVSDGLFGVRSFFALNEIVVTRGAMGRIIDFSLDIADTHIADMRGDGMVVATATGSTAYALSAGGPLVAPSFTGLITVPLSPHTLHSRAILTGDNDVVCVTLTGSDANREATLFADGDMLKFDKPVKRVYVRRGSEPTLLLRSQGEGFYDYASQTFF